MLYDRETGSEWKQSSGVCTAGEFEGRELTVLPAALVAYGRFRAATPDAPVLRPPGGESEAAGEGDDPAAIDYDLAPYERYFETPGSVLVLAGEAGVHAFVDPGEGYDFTREGGAFVADGTRWSPASGRSADGRELERLPVRRLFAFAWQDDHGPDAFWSGATGDSR